MVWEIEGNEIATNTSHEFSKALLAEYPGRGADLVLTGHDRLGGLRYYGPDDPACVSPKDRNADAKRLSGFQLGAGIPALYARSHQDL